MPNCIRPSLMWSRVATSSAIFRGWFSGITVTAVPTCRRLVRVAIEAAMGSDADTTERTGSKWISPSQMQSMPQASAWSTKLHVSTNASAWLNPCRFCSTNNPKCMREISLQFVPALGVHELPPAAVEAALVVLAGHGLGHVEDAAGQRQ